MIEDRNSAILRFLGAARVMFFCPSDDARPPGDTTSMTLSETETRIVRPSLASKWIAAFTRDSNMAGVGKRRYSPAPAILLRYGHRSLMKE